MAHSFEYNEKRIIAYLSNAMNETEKASFEVEIENDKELANLYDEISIQRYFSLQNGYEHFLLYEEEEETFGGEEEMSLFESRMEANKELAAKYEFEKSLRKVLDERHKKAESARIKANIDAIIHKKDTHTPQSPSETSPKPIQTNYKPYLLLLFIFILPLMYYVMFYKPSQENLIQGSDTISRKNGKDSALTVLEGQQVTTAQPNTPSPKPQHQADSQKIKKGNLSNNYSSQQKADLHIITMLYNEVLAEIAEICKMNEERDKCNKALGYKGSAPAPDKLTTNCKEVYNEYEAQKIAWEKLTLKAQFSLKEEKKEELEKYLVFLKDKKAKVIKALKSLKAEAGGKC